MLPDNGTQYCQHLAHLCGFAACGAKRIMRAAAAIQADTDALPDELKPYGEAMSKFITEVLIQYYVECLQLISELDLRDITRLALPFEQQTEQDSLQRSGRDEI